MRRAATGTIILALFLPLLPSCKGEPACDAARLESAVYGFYPGEPKTDVFARAKGRASWERLPDPRSGPRGEMYRFSAPLADVRGIDHARLTFLDGCLMEVIVYFRNTNVSTLNTLRRRLEEWYGMEATSPDGTIEMAYKTYWLKAPGMSVTLRRITKKPETELYIQFLHNELDERYSERKAAREAKMRGD